VNDTVHGWLEALASEAPAPGGGAAAGLLVSIGAALVEMVCNLTVGREKYKDVEQLMLETREAAGSLRREADRLREEDTAAFEVVSAAYSLPKGTAEEKASRSARIQDALRTATAVPLRTTEVGAEVLELAERVVLAVNRNVISDAGAAALSARAGAEASALNVRINLAAIKDATYTAAQAAALEALLARAERAGSAVLTAVDASVSR
jgi:formiminotetrahydrofolate cyclodeaminase